MLRAQTVGRTGLRRLKVGLASPGAVHFGNRHLTGEFRILAPDLFRLRVVRAGIPFPEASWAVVDRPWPAGVGRWNFEGGRIRCTTPSARWVLDLATGGWELTGAMGATLLRSIPGASGFAGPEPGVSLRLEEGQRLFGMGESVGPLERRGTVREFWNIDVLGHASCIHPGLRSLYVSIPFALSLREGLAAGLFWDNPARQTWDAGLTRPEVWTMRAASGAIDLYLFAGPSPAQVVERFSELTGRMPLPPRWALGYQQCRYSYESRRRLETIARTFRARRIPCDVLYLDIHHMNRYRVFTFGRTFPKPEVMIAGLRRRGFKVAVIVDPGVKDDPRFGVLRRGLAAGAFVRTADGAGDYVGEVWPGKSRFPDFLNAGVREWWGREQARIQRLGVDGFWNDMNEPANFALPSKTLPEDALHRSDDGPVSHAVVHNVYGQQMARASRAGALSEAPNRRPFVVTRAGYAGVQREAVVWTGDNSSCWEHLAESVPMLLNLSLSGVPFCGADVGGFLGDCTGELLARWTQLGSVTPFFRNHSNIGTIDQEPWAFGPRIEAICRRAIEFRYRLLPYLYGQVVEAHRTGTPILRPLFWDHPADESAFAASDQFLVGPDLLVAPVLRAGAISRSVYLPAGDWFDFHSGARRHGGRSIVTQAPLEVLPLFVRAGAVIPMGAVQQYVGERTLTSLELHVWVGGEGRCCSYEDDGVSLDYGRGVFCEREVSHRSSPNCGTIAFSAVRGGFASPVTRWTLTLHGTRRPVRAEVGGRTVRGLPGRMPVTQSFGFPNRRDPFTVSWRPE